jgi:hypothetical protein
MWKKDKKKLTAEQEFRILLLVLDKFLWLGFGIMAFGLYFIVSNAPTYSKGFSFMVIGALILVLFMLLLVREYEIFEGQKK